MQKGKFTPELVAPCGMNCGICKNYLAYSLGVPEKKGKLSYCPGCLPRNRNCYVKRGCRKLRRNEINSCCECDDVPCENLDRLDRRYRSRYEMSMVENIREIKEKGIKKFLENQEEKYACPECGDVVSVYCGKCYTCKK
jgi:hypothetical protein